eukprot:479752_1
MGNKVSNNNHQKFINEHKHKKFMNNIPYSDAYTYTGDPIPDLPDTRKSKPKKNKSLKQLTDTIIFGFIRTYCSISPNNTPQDIINLCLLFYCICDEFDESTSDPQLIYDKQHMTISKPHNCKEIQRYYAFGKYEVQQGQKRLWKFKITHSEFHRVTIAIGIIPTNMILQKIDFSNSNDYLYDKKRFQFILKNGKISDGEYVMHYCLREIKANDIIEMELDMPWNSHYATLSYTLNNISLGAAFNDIPTCECYTLCVSFERRDILQIIPTFQNSKNKSINDLQVSTTQDKSM